MPEGYALNWGAVAIASGVALLGMVIMFAASFILAPRRKSAMKGIPYECGIEPAPFSWSQIQIRYYIFAIFFLIFDVEAVFLFPWVVVFLESASVVFYEMLIFIGILFFGVVYGWKKRVLEWR